MSLRCRSLVAVAFLGLALNVATAQAPVPGFVNKKNYRIDVRSSARILADAVKSSNQSAAANAAAPLNAAGLLSGYRMGPDWFGPSLERVGGNVMVNDPNFDNIQIFPNTRPFVHTTESETALASSGSGIAAGYNSSASAIVAPAPTGGGLVFLQLLFTAYSFSNDGGKNWTSGFVPPVPGSAFTFGDPSMAVGPNGTIYYASLGADALGNSIVQMNKSTNGGMTWSPGVTVATDSGSDKEWIAVGPDGTIYITWSSFQTDGSVQLRLAKSTNGGDTWTQKIVYAPIADPAHPKLPQDQLSFTVPTVDWKTGTLYIPFVHFSASDQDFIRILISDDGAKTFHFAKFNIPRAPLTTVLPITQAGDLDECGASLPASEPVVLGGAAPQPQFIPNVRLAIHSGKNVGGSYTGLPRWVNSARMNPQPGFAVRNGILYLAWVDSRRTTVADLNAGSDVWFIRSDDGGKTWTKRIKVNPANKFDLYHVEPSLAIDDGDSVHIAYYTQHQSGRYNVDLANSVDRGKSFPSSRLLRVSTVSSMIPPTNVPLPLSNNPYNTTNYDRVVAQCYDMGEYLAVKSTEHSVTTVWGDDRRLIRQPVSQFDPLSGKVHSQQDVFFQTFEMK